MTTTTAETPATPDRTTAAYAALVAGVTCIGFAGIFTRWGHAPGIVVAAWRMTIATLVLFIPFIRQPAPARRVPRRLLLWTTIGAALFAADMGLWNAALDTTTAANATFMVNTAPIWVGLITLFVLRQRLPRLFWPGVGLALLGAGLIIFGGGQGFGAVTPGDLLALIAGVFWAGYQVVLAHVRGSGAGNLTALWIVVAISAALLIPAVYLSGAGMTGYDGQTALAILGAGLVSQIGGYLGINFALGYLPAARATVVILLQPVIAAVAAFLLLGEDFGGVKLVGGALILLGVYLVNRTR